MKFSISSVQNLNKQYGLSQDLTKVGVSKISKIIGAQLGEVDEIQAIGDKYQGIIISKVVTCQKHPNADKLNICMIDDGGSAKKVDRGSDGLVQVVCGAPNVKAGILVAWLPPGATVPESYDSEPFVLGARELRGVVSSGMLASPKELALGDSHDGILIIDDEHKPGTDFAKAYGLDNDHIIDIENKMFTHRPDCFGLLGVYRELAGIQGIAVKSPKWYQAKPDVTEPSAKILPLKITNDIPKLCSRFSAMVLSGVEVKTSPVWLQVELAKIGLKTINNIVDFTNYYSYLTGQPLHAYDYDKLEKLSGKVPSIVVRHPKKGETIKLLNGKTIEPRREAIMIATDQQLLGVGGVMGGSESEVDFDTKNIVLESANFDMYSIRRTSMAHGLFTDAVTRFNKGQSPLQTLAVLAKITDDICSNSGGKIASIVYDLNHLPKVVQSSSSVHPELVISADFINTRLGFDLSSKEIAKLLTNVEFQVHLSGQKMQVKAPFWRTDIECLEDIVEEVGRLHGYDNANLMLPLRSTKPATTNELLDIKTSIRNSLSKAGGNEILSYSFVHGKIIDKSLQDELKAYQISNALSPDLQYYRLSLTPSLLDKVHANIKAGYDHFAIYELGKTHNIDDLDADKLPAEGEVLAMVLSAGPKVRTNGAAYYQAQKFLTNLASDLNVKLEFTKATKSTNQQAFKPYDIERSAVVKIKGQAENLGIIGEFKTSVRHGFKLPAYTAGFEIDLPALLRASSSATSSYRQLSRFPSVTQDITLKIAQNLSFGDLETEVKNQLNKHLPGHSSYELNPTSIYQAKLTDKTKNISFRIKIANFVRTLTDKEINIILTKVSAELDKKLGAKRV
jgi:phenylalanyl-tRNA synthetase beta chain